MKRLAMAVLAVVVLAANGWAQGRLSRNPEADDGDRPRHGDVVVRGPAPNASVPGKAMRLIASAATIEDFDAGADDINADEKHHAFSTLSVSIAADPARTYLYACASTAGFWQQVPSDSPLILAALLLVRYDTALVEGGSFYQGFDIPERVREFEVSTRRVNHMPLPSGCGAVDETQLTLMFTSQFGMSDRDALALARQVIRGPLKLTVGFNARMRSVPDFGLSDPSLQVWSD